MKLKILSWNIWGGRFLDDVIAFLGETDVDIILLQEIIRDEDGGNTALTIAKALGYEPAVYNLDMLISSKWTGPVRDKEATLNFGNAVISKYPIESWKSYDLSPNDSRVIVSADIRVGEKTIHTFSVHLKHNHIGDKFSSAFDVLQVEQMNNLLKILPKENAIVAGDFNGPAESQAVQMIQGTFRDADPAQAPTWSAYPEGCSVCQPQGVQTRFDYIFVSPSISFDYCTVHHLKFSDHLPVSVIIEI